MKRTFTCLFLSVVMLFSLTTVSASIAVPERTSNNTWVEDYAAVLSSDTEKHIQEYSQRLADEHSACIMVVTVDFVKGSIQDYAISIFNQWKLGDANLNNGVLLLLSIGDDDYYMMIGRGLEKSFPIYDIQSLLNNYLEPDFARKDYDAGVMSVFRETYNYMQENIYNSSGTPAPNGHGSSNADVYGFIGALVMLVIVIIILIFVLRTLRTARRYYEPTYYYTRPRYRTYRSPFSYTPSSYSSHDTYYTPRSSSHSSGGGGGSFSHSSSSHSSGSGSSHGGSSRGAGAGRIK